VVDWVGEMNDKDPIGCGQGCAACLISAAIMVWLLVTICHAFAATQAKPGDLITLSAGASCGGVDYAPAYTSLVIGNGRPPVFVASAARPAGRMDAIRSANDGHMG
jgi:hypothetical protein